MDIPSAPIIAIHRAASPSGLSSSLPLACTPTRASPLRNMAAAAARSDSDSGGDHSIDSEAASDSSGPSLTAIGTPSEAAVKGSARHAPWDDSATVPPPLLFGNENTLQTGTPVPPRQTATSATSLLSLSRPVQLSHDAATPPQPQDVQPPLPLPSHLQSVLPDTPPGSSWTSSLAGSCVEDHSAQDSVYDLVDRVEAWRGGLQATGGTSLKRNKAYLGLWALGRVHDLMADPVLVTAVSSPAGSILSP